MNGYAVVVLAVSPGIFWLWYFYVKDKLEPEPKHLIAKTYFLGVVSAIPAVILEWPFGGLFLTVIAAPIIEEYVKFFVVRWYVYPKAEFDEPMDGIVYAAAAALGFASIENVFYLFGAYNYPGENISPSVSVLTLFAARGLLSVPGHVLDSAMWGYGLGLAKFAKEEDKTRFIRNGLLLGMALHGLFNFLASFNTWLSFGILIVFYLGCWWLVRRRIASALSSSPFGGGLRISPSSIEVQGEEGKDE